MHLVVNVDNEMICSSMLAYHKEERRGKAGRMVSRSQIVLQCNFVSSCRESSGCQSNIQFDECKPSLQP